VLLASTWVIQRIWNSLVKDFPRLPPLDFRRALGLVTIWGLLFLLVLTMISGARELMTPGAWKKQGFTYVLTQSAEPHDQTNLGAESGAKEGNHPPIEDDRGRREALDRLRAALWKYAATHQGRFPTSESISEIPEMAWRIADPSGLHFVYQPGLAADEGIDAVAYEPGLFGQDRWLLLTDGTLIKKPIGEIQGLIQDRHDASGPKPRAGDPR
jgi:hypothetical protein